MYKYVVALVMACLAAVGCAGFFTTPSSEQVLAKIAIQQATVRAIQAAPADEVASRAERVVAIVDEALAVLEGAEDGVITSEELAAVVARVLPQELSPADKLLVQDLVALIAAEIQARVPAPQLGLPVAEVSVVLGWVREAAVVAVPPVLQ